MKVERREFQGVRYWVPCDPFSQEVGWKPWYMKPICELNGMWVKSVSMMSPGRFAKVVGSSDVPRACVLHGPSGNKKQLLTAAARLGFPRMTCFFLQKLCAELFVRVKSARRSPTEAELVGALVRHAIPAASDEFVQECLTKRAAKSACELDSVVGRKTSTPLKRCWRKTTTATSKRRSPRSPLAPDRTRRRQRPSWPRRRLPGPAAPARADHGSVAHSHPISNGR